MTAPPTNDRVFLAHFCRFDCWRRGDCEWVWEGKEYEQCPAYLIVAKRIAEWGKILCWKPNTETSATFRPTREDIPEGE